MKQVMRKEKKHELETWTTKRIKTSMKLRYELYKEAGKEDRQKFKKYESRI